MDDVKVLVTSLDIVLRDRENNNTIYGELSLPNVTLWREVGEEEEEEGPRDASGQSLYMTAVMLTFGMVMVVMIASYATRKSRKIREDKEIRKYLMEYQVVQERYSKETYRDLKHRIKAQVDLKGDRGCLQKSFSHAFLPMIAVTVPHFTDASSLHSFCSMLDARSRASSRSSVASPPRSRTYSIGEQHHAHAHAPTQNYGRFLAPPDPADVMGSPGRERRKGLAYLFQGRHHHDAKHLERILEESLDSRQNSFRRKDSRKSMTSQRCNSVTSLPEVVVEMSASDNTHLPHENVEQAKTLPESSLADEAVITSPTSNDVSITMECNASETEGSQLLLTSPDRICGMRETHLLCDESDDGSWLRRHSETDTETDDVSDEAYASGFHLSLQSAHLPGVSTCKVSRLVSHSDVTRLPPLHDVAHSTDSENESLYITNV